MKTVYVYDNDGVYLYPEKCYPSGLEEGLFIEPTFSTEIEPPIVEENHVAQFLNGIWISVPSYIGETWYDQTTGTPTIIEAIGLPASNLGATLPLFMLLEKAKATQIAVLQSAYQKAIAAPVEYTTANGYTATFSIDSASVSNLEKVLLAHADTKVFSLGIWPAADNSIVTPFTYEDLQSLANTIAAIDEPDYLHLLTLIAQVQSITTSVVDIQAINW